MIDSHLEGEPSLEFLEGHAGFALSVVVSLVLDVGERSTRKKVNFADGGADHALDVPAKVRSARWTVVKLDPKLLAAPSQRA